MITPLSVDDTSDLPTFENRLAAYLRAYGVGLSPGEYVVREARLICRLAGQGLDAETLAEVRAFVQARPHVPPGDEWGPA